MFTKPFRHLAVSFLATGFLVSAIMHGQESKPRDPGFSVHEWGTFTSIAGKDGAALEWQPLNGSTDLPAFVEHLSSASFKPGLAGTVRMETPVLYFHASREMNVSVHVAFSKGLITEWYPRASRVEPAAALTNVNLSAMHHDGSISWQSITLHPDRSGPFPREDKDNPYYAARETSATPLEVSSSADAQREKFIFYRGVSVFPVPVAAKISPAGKLRLENLTREIIPATILFERRGEKIGYRLAGALQYSNVLDLDSPELTATPDSLARDLEGILVQQGLFPDEAHAMVNTWKSSWFEEGSRLLYIVPRSFVDSVLPLAINPAPDKIVRVFVGRLELVTPATTQAVAQALASRDRAALAKFGRFLEPILRTMQQNEPDPARAGRIMPTYYSIIADPPRRP
jgi:hypothetical protein